MKFLRLYAIAAGVGIDLLMHYPLQKELTIGVAHMFARSRHQHAFTMIELMMVVAIITILASLLLPGLRTTREKARMVRCKQNLRQIGTAMQMYSNKHLGMFPYANTTPDEDNLAALYPEFVDELRIFECPSSGDSVNSPADLTHNAGGAGAGGMSYEYRPHFTYLDGFIRKDSNNIASVASQIPMVHDQDESGQIGRLDNLDNHGMDGINVLYADWHVELITEESYAKDFINKDTFDSNVPTGDGREGAGGTGPLSSISGGSSAGNAGGDYPNLDVEAGSSENDGNDRGGRDGDQQGRAESDRENGEGEERRDNDRASDGERPDERRDSERRDSERSERSERRDSERERSERNDRRDSESERTDRDERRDNERSERVERRDSERAGSDRDERRNDEQGSREREGQSDRERTERRSSDEQSNENRREQESRSRERD